MLSRRVPSPGVLRYPFSRRILHAQRDSESESVKITMPARSEAPSLDALDLENGEWNDVKPQRGTRLVRRLLACQVGGKSVGWIALTVLQTIVIFVLLIYLHRSAVAIESPDSAAEQTWHRSTFVHEEDTRKLNHLIMVPGHGVTIKESLDGVDSKDESWFLLKYQRSKDVPKALVGHIRGGLDELDADDDALLLFSGGKTRLYAGPKSEGESYFFVADHFKWWGRGDLRSRASTEDFARDSFENLMFSICRFKEITGQYPTKITVVGFDFKETRFHDLHRAAIRFPADDFHYIGKRPGGRFDHTEAEEGERKSALEPYKEDPYGCLPNGALLTKRVERNPFHRTPPYGLSCPEMQGLLDWCEPEVFHGDLPWSPMKTEDGS